jgi:CheY-like chemotaxis protein
MAEDASACARHARVLVIDDERALLNMFRLLLADEHHVVTSDSAREALARIASGEPFDLVLCDLTMEGMTGIDFHEGVGEVAPALRDRIVFMTGGACTPRAEAFLARPDVRHIAKPFPPVAELREVVRAHLRRIR